MDEDLLQSVLIGAWNFGEEIDSDVVQRMFGIASVVMFGGLVGDLL